MKVTRKGMERRRGLRERVEGFKMCEGGGRGFIKETG